MKREIATITTKKWCLPSLIGLRGPLWSCVECGTDKVPLLPFLIGAVFWSFRICLFFLQARQLIARVRTHWYNQGQQMKGFRDRVFSEPGCSVKR